MKNMLVNDLILNPCVKNDKRIYFEFVTYHILLSKSGSESKSSLRITPLLSMTARFGLSGDKVGAIKKKIKYKKYIYEKKSK